MQAFSAPFDEQNMGCGRGFARKISGGPSFLCDQRKWRRDQPQAEMVVIGLPYRKARTLSTLYG
jgi:hypothetical protein